MNPLALALSAIKQQLGSQHRPVVPGLNDPEAMLQDTSIASGNGGDALMPRGMLGSTPLFNNNPPAKQAEELDAVTKQYQANKERDEKIVAKLLEDKAKADKEHKAALDAYVNLHHPEVVKAKKMTDSQKFIPAVLAFLANISPDVRRTNAANNAAMGYWGGVNKGNQQEADLANQQNDANYRDQAARLGLVLKESGDTLDRTGQDYANAATRLAGSQDKLTLGLETNAAKKEMNAARIAGKASLQELMLKSKSPVEVQQMMMNANQAAIAQGQPAWYTPEQIAQVPFSAQFKNLAQGTAALSNADLAKSKKQTEDELRAGRVQALKDRHKLDDANARKIERFLIEAPERFRADLAAKAATTAKALRAPQSAGEKPATPSAKRAAIKSELSVLKEAIKEASKPDAGQLVPDFAKLVPLFERREELTDLLENVNNSVIQGKAPAP